MSTNMSPLKMTCLQICRHFNEMSAECIKSIMLAVTNNVGTISLPVVQGRMADLSPHAERFPLQLQHVSTIVTIII